MVVDSVTFHFRQDFSEQMARRTRLLGQMAQAGRQDHPLPAQAACLPRALLSLGCWPPDLSSFSLSPLLCRAPLTPLPKTGPDGTG